MKVICIHDNFFDLFTGLPPTHPCPKKDEICDVTETVHWKSHYYHYLVGYGDILYVVEAFAPIGTSDDEIKLVEIKEEELEIA